jgi:hypothetical protein
MFLKRKSQSPPSAKGGKKRKKLFKDVERSVKLRERPIGLWKKKSGSKNVSREAFLRIDNKIHNNLIIIIMENENRKNLTLYK